MTGDNTVSYSPPASYVDSSFFIHLSTLKLNVLKLDTSYQDILGFYNYIALSSNQPPSFNLSDISFKEAGDFESNLPKNTYFKSSGKLFNVNSIEEFKNINKRDLLIESTISSVYNKIKNKSFIYDPSILSSFTLLTFADLKKYKFYYWFAFSQLKSNWKNTSIKQGVTFDYTSQQLYEQQFYIIDNNSLVKLDKLFDFANDEVLNIVLIDTCSFDNTAAYILRNFLTALAYHNFHKVEIQVLKYNRPESNFTAFFENLDYNENIYTDSYMPPISGWEKTSNGKLGPKLANLGALIDPIQLADQSIDLNLKLMKWRLVPDLDLNIVKNSKVLILGSGTLGSYTARCLLAWGVRKITFVDNGKVSFSNPVRQPLFNYEDCLNGGEPKAETASNNLKKIFPLVDSKGYTLDVPMIGHPISNETKVHTDYKLLEKLVDEHDAIFLLLDSREARWLPTVMGYSKNKIVINAALGFESYLVMRHGSIDPSKNIQEQITGRLGCYYCNDLVAPTNSITDRSLDQMCTVTRPGVALMASSLATELFVSILQSENKQHTPHTVSDRSCILGSLPHQLRGFLHNFELMKLSSNNFKHCTACSNIVVETFKNEGWEFVKNALNNATYLENLTGLKEFQEQAEKAAELMEELEDFGLDDDAESF